MSENVNIIATPEGFSIRFSKKEVLDVTAEMTGMSMIRLRKIQEGHGGQKSLREP